MKIKSTLGVFGVLVVFPVLAIISGGIGYVYSGYEHRENEWFTLIGSVDSDIEGVEAQILPLNKTISWGDVKDGRFVIKLTKAEARKMEVIKFKFHSKGKGLIEYDAQADSNIAEMHLDCLEGIVRRTVNAVSFCCWIPPSIICPG